jgi:hypothetical protein
MFLSVTLAYSMIHPNGCLLRLNFTLPLVQFVVHEVIYLPIWLNSVGVR